jgi:hypothetical protein
LINKGFLNTNSVITKQLMRTARMLEAEWRQYLRERVGMEAKEDESSTGFSLELTNSLFPSLSIFFAG